MYDDTLMMSPDVIYSTNNLSIEQQVLTYANKYIKVINAITNPKAHLIHRFQISNR